MSIWKRAISVMKSKAQEPSLPPRNPLEDSRVGDIVTVDLEEYVISGKVVYFDRGYEPHRYTYYIQNGKLISCLLVEKGRTYDSFLCGFVEGALDDPNDVPTRLDLGQGELFELEHYRKDLVRTEGRTDFRSHDEVIIWRYVGGGDRYFFLQWQDGKYVAMLGSRTPSAHISFIKGS